MENNMILLLLNNEEINELNIRGFYHISQYNNCVVPTSFMCEAIRLLSRIESEKLEKIQFTKEEVELLKESSRSYYLYLQNKEVGETLYEKVYKYLEFLKREQIENNVEF